MNELTINLKADSQISLYEQIYEHIRNEIRNGNLQCGIKLPSTRILSAHLQVSRSTVQMAYDQLVSEGYIESEACRGYFVSQVEGLYNVHLSRPDNKPAAGQNEQKDISQRYKIDFSPRGIDLYSFPFNTWRKVTKNVLTDDNRELFSYGSVQGELEFRRTISDYLYQSRGVAAKPENIIIGAGNDYLLMLINQILKAYNASDNLYAMENPTYRQTYRVLQSLGERITVVEQDRNGMSITGLINSKANIAYVMPSHQFPLGTIMPVKRRTELLKWASDSSDRYILEDDYDSEFRYKGKPIPALCSFDKEQKVIYIGTFSKAIAPAIRMSYVVLPDKLMECYRRNLSFYSCTVSRIDQMVVRNFMEQGYYERHLNKLRAMYKSRHDALMEGLVPFRDNFDIAGENAGIHVMLHSKEDITEKELIDMAQNVGVRVYPMSENDISDGNREYNTVILGYARLDEKQIVEGLECLKTAWKI
jgi:GntR family transcriptional regulator/MocR family aminotransferase